MADSNTVLYNTLSDKEREKLIDLAGKERITLSFYKYHQNENVNAFCDHLFLTWNALDVLGRIYVANEGINAQLSVPADRFQEFKKHLDGFPFMREMRLNIAVEQDNKSFLKLKIKVRRKIVADGIEDKNFDVTRSGPHLRAQEFNELIANPDTVLVDMRNHYESEIGHFDGAITPEVETFRESLDIVTDNLRDQAKDKNVVMYCTGGIRCEKASAYFMHKGFEKVFQLDGGIIEYLRQVKSEGLENKFKGKNFVFDRRLAERISNDVVSACHLCDAPSDHHQNCRNNACNVLLILCPACRERLQDCCSEPCREIAALPRVVQKEMRKGYSAPKRYFKREKKPAVEATSVITAS